MRAVPESLDAIGATLAGLSERMESIAARHEPTGDLNEVASAVHTLMQCLIDLGLWVDDLGRRVNALSSKA
jgi:hypothetical protein